MMDGTSVCGWDLKEHRAVPWVCRTSITVQGVTAGRQQKEGLTVWSWVNGRR